VRNGGGWSSIDECSAGAKRSAGLLFPQQHQQHHPPSLNPQPRTVNVYLPKDRVTNAHQGYGFVEFRGEEDADYVSRVSWVARCYVGVLMVVVVVVVVVPLRRG